MWITVIDIISTDLVPAPGSSYTGRLISFEAKEVSGRAVLVTSVDPEKIQPGLKLSVETKQERTTEFEQISTQACACMIYEQETDSYVIEGRVTVSWDDGSAGVQVGECHFMVDVNLETKLVEGAWIRCRIHGLSLWDTGI